MESNDHVDRREYRRVPIDMDIEVCHLHGEEAGSELSVVSCRGRDVSGGGVSFYGETRYQNESLLRLRILLGKTEQSQQVDTVKLLKVMGKVMWSRKDTDSNNYVIGVQFLNIYEQDFELLNEYVGGSVLK